MHKRHLSAYEAFNTYRNVCGECIIQIIVCIYFISWTIYHQMNTTLLFQDLGLGQNNYDEIATLIIYEFTPVADPGGGGLGGLTPPPLQSFFFFFFFCLSVYENSHGPGP